MDDYYFHFWVYMIIINVLICFDDHHYTYIRLTTDTINRTWGLYVTLVHDLGSLIEYVCHCVCYHLYVWLIVLIVMIFVSLLHDRVSWNWNCCLQGLTISILISLYMIGSCKDCIRLWCSSSSSVDIMSCFLKPAVTEWSHPRYVKLMMMFVSDIISGSIMRVRRLNRWVLEYYCPR